MCMYLIIALRTLVDGARDATQRVARAAKAYY